MSKATGEVFERWNFSIKTDSVVVERKGLTVELRNFVGTTIKLYRNGPLLGSL